jgi:hypothetical protein
MILVVFVAEGRPTQCEIRVKFLGIWPEKQWVAPSQPVGTTISLLLPSVLK